MKRILSVLLSVLILILSCIMPVGAADSSNSIDDVVINAGVIFGVSMPVVYISDSGSDVALGTQQSPFGSLAMALDCVEDGGTIIITDTYTLPSSFLWETHNKSVTINGGTLDSSAITGNLEFNDNVTFDNITITFASGSNWFANGYKFTFGSNVTVTNQAASSANIYGGGIKGSTVKSTDVTLLSGNFLKVYGGSYYGTVEGNTNLYVGGTVNSGIDVTDHSGVNNFYGGGYGDNIKGSTDFTFTGSAKGIYLYGGSRGSGSKIAGGSNVLMSGGSAMSLFGGNISADSGSGATTVITGGELEQVFGGNDGANMTGDAVVKVLGGTITRRVYGGCYNNGEVEYTLGVIPSGYNFKTAAYVKGNATLIIGGNANITFSLTSESDRSIYGHSRHDSPSTEEYSRIIFDDSTAYDNYISKLGAQDWPMTDFMSGVSAADYIHYYTYSASGSVLTQTCSECGTSHSAAAALDLDTSASLVYTAKEITPYSVVYNSGTCTDTYMNNWYGGGLDITYTNNVNAGTATASITKEGVTATASFVIQKAENTNVPVISAQAETISGKADGVINGLDTSMEISTNGTDYTAVTDAGALFAAGTYYVRYAQTDNFKASNSASVTVEEGRKLVVTLDFGNGIKQSSYVSYSEAFTLPDTGFKLDNNWYNSLEGNQSDIVAEKTIYPTEDITLYSLGALVDAKDVNGYTGETQLKYSQNFDVVSDGSEYVLYYAADDTTDSGYGSNHLRLGTVNDNTTYKITVTYKATGGNLGFAYLTADGNDIGSYDTGLHGANDSCVYEVSNTNGEYITAVMFVTTDLIGTLSYNSTNDTKTVLGDCLYFSLKDYDTAGESDIYIKDITVTAMGSVLEDGGISVLIPSEETNNNMQALRYYFDYVTDDGSNIYIDGVQYTVVERGFLYRNGNFTSNTQYVDENGLMAEGTGGMTIDGISTMHREYVRENLDKYWRYDTQTKELRFSTYVTGFDKNDTTKLMVRGYVTILVDGQEMTVYSKTSNASVQAIKDQLTDYQYE